MQPNAMSRILAKKYPSMLLLLYASAIENHSLSKKCADTSICPRSQQKIISAMGWDFWFEKGISIPRITTKTPCSINFLWMKNFTPFQTIIFDSFFYFITILSFCYPLLWGLVPEHLAYFSIYALLSQNNIIECTEMSINIFLECVWPNDNV